VNQEILNEIKNQEYSTLTNTIEEFLKKQVSQYNSNGLIFGLSGGIDSAVIAHLCSRVFKKESIALIMPDSKITPNIDIEDALKMAKSLGLEYKLMDINLISNEYAKYIEPNDLALGNLKARIRANLLYYYANSKNLLVVGSSDKSEYLIGYFTKFGDGSADILPIVSLYKSQVREIAKFLGVPDLVIAKKSSPQLWKEHIAEDEIGASYDEIDSILYCTFEKKMTIEETVKSTQIEKKIVDKIYQLYKNSQHKRITAARP
jgi:NAD+ synthase